MPEKIDKERIERIIELMAEGKVEESLKSVDAEDVDHLFVIGALFFEEGVYDVAEKVFDRVIQLVPDNG